MTTLRELSGKGKLELAHPHERDARITFEEHGHKYFIDGVRYNDDQMGGVSSTTFIHAFFKEFDKKGCVAGILRNRRWGTDPEYRYYQKTEDEILAMWAAAGKDACERGTAFHAAVEYHQNDLDVPKDIASTPEFQQYLAFRRDHPTWKPYRTEMMLFDEDHRITGAIDALMIDVEDDQLILCDWKRSKEIKRSAFRTSDRGLFPLSSLQNCNYVHYSLQLTLYKNILRRKYGWNVKLCTLIVCYPTQATYQRIDVLDVEYEIELMLGYRKLQLQKLGYTSQDPTVTSDEWALIRTAAH